jgi:hypothetical protein
MASALSTSLLRRHRFSLKSLAELERGSSQSSRVLLESVVERLQCQLASDFLTTTSTTSTTHHINQKKDVDTLRYIHQDTCRLAHELLMSERPWQRFGAADRHLISATVAQIAARHAKSIETVVQMVERNNHDLRDNDDAAFLLFHDGAERFLRRRLGIQLLCHHCGELLKDDDRPPGGAVAIDSTVKDVVDDAIAEATHVVEAHLLVRPEVNVVVVPPTAEIRATFVRSWLTHSLVELLKNAMAAVVQRHHHHHQHPHNYARDAASLLLQEAGEELDLPALPPIEVRLFHNRDAQTVVIEIVDDGTGLTGGNDDIDSVVFRIGHSSQTKRWDRLNEQQSYAAVRSPLSSLGVGLPVALYQTEHFGGQLILRNNNNKYNHHHHDDHDDGNTEQQQPRQGPKRQGCTARMELPLDDTLLERIIPDQ